MVGISLAAISPPGGIEAPVLVHLFVVENTGFRFLVVQMKAMGKVELFPLWWLVERAVFGVIPPLSPDPSP